MATPTRVANKTIWALDDIDCLVAQQVADLAAATKWIEARMVEAQFDAPARARLAQLLLLHHRMLHAATDIRQLAADARRGDYNGNGGAP